MSETLTDEEIAEQLPPEWEYVDDEIVRSYDFDDYLAGVAFASEVGELADEAFHHPTIVIEYDTVEIRFTSHEAGGVTEQDLELAAECDALR
ncbi:4a-hydroxytetrahydrobiopterin dehydratase [Halarchaeum rubridurum]|uniref:Putative pterin-4-alpha-carbinolamine dehydratase n=1 Tax=Halarchaeum rubridurum TaxID=489911 RepID=A0A830FXN7_9EURY|nr:4a-hydroxytetrahydrobiopterin dehydratase [Halarchaeum rubridurum]MBP1953869.1 4a-hydroxytetrahydrobiopterin dehydratase [Halarchaeum rubridurum]GGM55481.1 4a-hydroxytetrahydrobiopterin dehydratase [Halarchaeum rubridurum]